MSGLYYVKLAIFLATLVRCLIRLHSAPVAVRLNNSEIINLEHHLCVLVKKDIMK